MSDTVVGAEVRLKIDKFLAALDQLPEAAGVAGKAISQQLSKEIKAAEKAYKESSKGMREAAAQRVTAEEKAAEATRANATASWRTARAIDDAAEAAGRARGAVGGLGDRAGRMGEAFAKSRGILSSVSPMLGDIAGFGNDAADGIEVLSSSAAAAGPAGRALASVLGAVALAAAPLAGHLVVLSREADELAARSAFLAAHLHVLDSATRGYEDAVLDAQVAVGTLSEKEAALQRIRDSAARSVKDFQAAQEAERKTAEESVFTNERVLRRLGALPGVLSTAIDYYGGYTSALQESRWTLSQLDAQEGAHQDIVVGTTAAQVTATTATARRTVAVDALKARLDALNAAMQLEGETARANAAAYQGGLAALEQQELAAQRAVATQMERLDLDRQAAGAAADASRGRSLSAAASASAIETVEVQHRDTLRALDEAYYADRKKLRDADAQKASAAALKSEEEARRAMDAMRATQLANVNAVGGYVSQGLSMVSAAHDDAYQVAADGVTRLEAQLAASEAYLTAEQKKALEGRIKAQRDAAEKQFNAAKNAKAAEALASTFLAGINAIAQSPPPSPFGIAGAAIATGLGLAAVGNIEAQQFTAYKGGLTPDEVPATLHRREAVLSQLGRATLGDEDINRANAGVSAAPTQVEVLFQYRHKQFDRAIADTAARGGALDREISTRSNAGSSGHRSR